MFKKIEPKRRGCYDRSSSIHFRVYRHNESGRVTKRNVFVIGKNILPKLGLSKAKYVDVYVDGDDPNLFMLLAVEKPGFRLSDQSSTSSAKTVALVRDNLGFDYGQYDIEIVEKREGRSKLTVLRVIPKLEGVK